MALLYHTSKLFYAGKCSTIGSFRNAKRNLISKNLFYTEFGDPLQVVKFREMEVPPLKSREVLVRMLASPVNPADINTIQGKNCYLPQLPCVPGDEGVGDVVETGDKVSRVDPGERVVLTSRLLGAWNYYGIYDERDVHVISSKIPLPEAAMLTIAPCSAYRMLKDFRNVRPGETVMQNAANSPCGQCVIQLCKSLDIKTFNIVANHCNYETVKQHLLSIGATTVCTLEEAEELTSFDTSLTRPVLGLNCLGGRFENVMITLLERNGTMVYYGCSYDLPIVKNCVRPDVLFYKFDLYNWDAYATVIDKDVMMNNIVQLMAVGKFKAPLYESVEIKDYVHALRNTASCEAFSTLNYVFDFTLP